MMIIEKVEQDAQETKQISIQADSQTSKQNEYHIASFVAQVITTEMDQIKLAIEQVSGSEIHAVSPEGKIVFTIEGSHQAGIGRNIDQLKYNPGLLSLAPIYHQFITEDSDSENFDSNTPDSETSDSACSD
jgi:nitrate reductase NapD